MQGNALREKMRFEEDSDKSGPRRTLGTPGETVPRAPVSASNGAPYFAGGTYSLGTAEPSPKKNMSICFTMTS
jgi:hypothetical protein